MTKNIKIGHKSIGDNQPCFIIAEAGVNHNGKLSLAKKLVDEAKEAGADAIKFQAYMTEELISPDAPKAKYQKKSVPELSQYEMLKRLEFSRADFRSIKKYCGEKKILFLASCFDSFSAELLRSLNVPAYKIGSGELTNLPLIKQVASYGKPIILSTGMANLLEVERAVQAINSLGNKEIVLLHCTTNYPAKMQNLNLLAIRTLAKRFKLPVGYSDHTTGLVAAVVARTLGACVLEKHFTLDRKMTGPDHQASIEKKELQTMVRNIRDVEVSLGDGHKKMQVSELEMKKIARKSLGARADIAKGVKITSEMLNIIRPGTGIAPEKMQKIIGKKTKNNIKKGSLINWNDIQ